MTQFRDGYFSMGDITLHYVEAGRPRGEAPTVLFYHGFPSFWYCFHLQMTALGERFHVVAVDGLGANLSSRPASLEPYRVENLALQLDQLARHLIGDESFYLVGHDWGGALSWAYAQAFPLRLNKLVVMSAPPLNQLLGLLRTDALQRERSSYMYAMRSGKLFEAMTANNNQQVCDNICAGLKKSPYYSEQMEAEFRRGLSTPGAIDGGINWYRANIPLLEDMTDADFWPSKDAKTNVPALLIWGDADLTFVDHFIEDLPDFAPNLEVFRLPGVGHSPMLERPDEVNQRLLEFLT